MTIQSIAKIVIDIYKAYKDSGLGKDDGVS
jgi:hypothetical protein